MDIEHVDTIVDLRRALVMGESRFPAEAGAMLRNLESRSNPWGVAQSQRADWAEGMDVPVVNGAAPEYLYWVGCAGSFDERAKRHLPSRGGAAAAGRGLVRDPRAAGALHGRPRPADGQRVPVPDARGAERRDDERGRGHQGHRELPALLQHAPQRVPAVRRELRGHPPHGAARPAGGGRPAPPDGGRSRPSSRTTTRATWGATTRCTTRPATSWRASPASARWRCRGTRNAGCAAVQAARGCGWRKGSASASTSSGWTKRPPPGADTVGVACPYCLIMLDDGAKGRGDTTEVLDIAQVVRRSLPDESPAPGSPTHV